MNLESADMYFAKHLDRSFWSSQADDVKESALSMAAADVMAEAVAEVTSSPFLADAVCEQAVYLIRNYTKQTEGKIITGQSLGDMSQSFAVIHAGKPGISPRALVYIEVFRKTALRGPVRIARG